MDKYLLQILHETNTIIIPGLGALTVTNKDTGEIMFMSYLKHDDGNLVKYIVEKEGLSENDAKNMISKYVRDIHAKLDIGDSYDMYQFGSFTKNAGEIEFQYWEKNQDKSTVETPENPIAAKDIKIEEKSIEKEIIPEKVPEIKEETPKITPESQINNVEEIAKLEIETSKPNVEEKKIIEENKIDVTKLNPTENIYITENEVKEIAKKQAQEPQKKVLKEKVKKEKKKKSPVFWILIVLGIIIVIGGATSAIFYDKLKPLLFGATEQKNEELNHPVDNEKNLEEIEKQVALESENTEENQLENTENKSDIELKEPEKPKPITVEKVVNNGQMPFHIIAGGFGVEENANRLAKKYRDEGENASVLGQFDELFLVSYSSFSSKEEAIEKLKSSGINAWIFKYPK